MTNLAFLVRLIAAGLLAHQNKALIAEVADLRTEIGFLREQLPAKQKLRFSDPWRKKLPQTAAGVGWRRMAEITSVAMAQTIRGWHRLMIAG